MIILILSLLFGFPPKELVIDSRDPRVLRIVERAIRQEMWYQAAEEKGLIHRSDRRVDKDAAALLDTVGWMPGQSVTINITTNK